MPKRSKLLLTGLVWIAFIFRLPSLFHNRFQADEAIFASWARQIAVWRDPLLKMQPVDKPPLLFYLQSLFFPLFGPVEWAARLPNLAASLLLVPLTALLVWLLYQDSLASLFSGALVALSPLAIQFSSTAFIDPLMTFFVTGAVLFTVYKPSPFVSGLLFGFSVAAKYQAWLFLPLLASLAWIGKWDRRCSYRWLSGFLPVLIALFAWESVREAENLLITRQLTNFGGLRLVWSWELMQRLSDWAQLWRLSLGSLLVPALFLASCFFLLFRAFRKQDKLAVIDLLLILFFAAYMTLHWLLAIPVWDRYLLPVLPLVTIISARGFVSLLKKLVEVLSRSTWSARLNRNWLGAGLLALILISILFLTPGAIMARDGRFPLGGQPNADHGAWQIAQYLENEPYGTVLYDHWYSWHWRYHLFDKKVYVSWFSDPSALTTDLEAFIHSPGRRYIVLPNGPVSGPVLRALDSGHFQIISILETDTSPGMILYRLVSEKEME